jgi:F-type H+-transporting ATPase subunit b
MGLDWSTFFLELINFLILIWILKRFLYAPVKAAIEARRERVESVLAQADARRAEAERMRQDYEARLQAWEQERAQARAVLDRDLAAERVTRLDAVEAELKARRDKAAILDERRGREIERRNQEAALALAAQFGSRLLARLADSALEARLVDLLVEDLPSLSARHRETLAEAAEGEPPNLRVRSAYPLSDSQRKALESALRRAAGRELRCAFERDPGLVAGLQIDAGPLVMRANLRDELSYFAESAALGPEGILPAADRRQ